MDERGFVCIFAKALRAGEVKTRLASAVGDQGALELARAFFQDTSAVVRALPWAHSVLATTEPAAAGFDLAANPEIWLQGDGDLGLRLERVLRRALERGPFAIAVGADSPGLPPRLLERARRALKTADAVLGPCDDGGFYLLGLRCCLPGLLADLPWSSSDTFTLTLSRLRQWGLDVVVLEPWFDVDVPRDLLRLADLLERGEIAAPHTARALARLRGAMERTS